MNNEQMSGHTRLPSTQYIKVVGRIQLPGEAVSRTVVTEGMSRSSNITGRPSNVSSVNERLFDFWALTSRNT